MAIERPTELPTLRAGAIVKSGLFVFVSTLSKGSTERAGMNWLLPLQGKPSSLAWSLKELLLALPTLEVQDVFPGPLVDLVALCIPEGQQSRQLCLFSPRTGDTVCLLGPAAVH
jgi:hypothetical protein